VREDCGDRTDEKVRRSEGEGGVWMLAGGAARRRKVTVGEDRWQSEGNEAAVTNKKKKKVEKKPNEGECEKKQKIL